MGTSGWRSRYALLLLLAAAPGCGDDTNAPGGTGSLSGHIATGEERRPVADASLSVASLTARTDADGSYRFPAVPAGEQTLSVSHSGYRTERVPVTIERNSETTQDLLLVPAADVPDGLTRLSAASGSVDGSVRLEWEPVSLTQFYSIYFASSPGVSPATGTKLSPVASPFLVTGLTPGSTYYFVITPIGQASEGPPSPEVHAVARSGVSVTMISPTIGAFVDTLVSIEARISSVASLTGVTARIGTITSPMTFTGDRWRATLSLAALQSPVTVLVEVSASDASGNPAGASVSARFDRHPALTVTAPLNGEVARPTAAIRATCTDDSPTGCVSVTVVNAENEAVLFSGQGSVNSTFSLAGFDGQEVPLEVRATDNGGQVTAVRRAVFVETTPSLEQVASSGSGILLDADPARLLAVNTGRWRFENPGGDTLRLVDRATGASTPVFQAESLTVTGRLTPAGALFVTVRPNGVTSQLRELRNGAVTILAEGEPITLVEVADRFAAWFEPGGLTSRLMWRHLTAGTTRQVANGRLNGSADLAPNGDLVYVEDGEVFRFRAGTSRRITDNAASGLRARTAGTDGTLIVEGRRPADCCDAALPLETVLLDPGGDVILASTDVPEQQSLLFLVNGGWIAFTRYDANGAAQVWVRSPAGVETQLSALSAGVTALDAMSPAGEVVFQGLRASPGRPPEPIGGGATARPLYIGNQLFLLYGASLFRVP
jgi:hypothetical protein